MPGKKDAAWWRAHRAKKRLEQQQSAGLQSPATPQAQVAQQVAPRPLSLAQKVAAGLAAPDDDCGACGHDRQQYHLPAELPCRGPAPYARGGVCRCPAFVDSANPF